MMVRTLEQRMADGAERGHKAGNGLYALTLDLDRPKTGPGLRPAFVCVNCGQRFNELRPDGTLSNRHIRFDTGTNEYRPTRTGAKAGLVADRGGISHRCPEKEIRVALTLDYDEALAVAAILSEVINAGQGGKMAQDLAGVTEKLRAAMAKALGRTPVQP